jgi:hypothetical protein
VAYLTVARLKQLAILFHDYFITVYGEPPAVCKSGRGKPLRPQQAKAAYAKRHILTSNLHVL